MDATTRVTCTKFRCVLSAGICATRCAARLPSGRGRGAPKFYPCGGACRDGALVLLQLLAGGWTPPPDTIPAAVQEPQQRRARLRWMRSFPSYLEPQTERLDVLRELALTTPDDCGVSADAG